MSQDMRIALGTICAFNAVIMGALSALAYRYVNGTAGVIGAILFALSAIALLTLSRRLRPYADG